MRLNFRTAATLASALLAAACAGEPAAPDASGTAPAQLDGAVVVLYRPHADARTGDYPFVYVDDVRKGPLPDGGMLVTEVSAGSHRILLANPAMWEGRQYWPVNAMAGRRYFYRLRSGEFPDEETASARYLSKDTRVDEVPEDAASAEIEALQPAEKAASE